MSPVMAVDISAMDELKSRLKATWMTGDYDVFARYLETGADEFFRHLKIESGTSLLDVACGAGQLALIAARAGVRTTGCDIATNWLEKARVRAIAEGLHIAFREGDAEELPFPDASFDAVASIFGAMFAPRPATVAAEMARVCRRGGKIAMANWTASGFIGRMFKAIARHIAPPGMPSPVLWGDEAVVRERFGDALASLRCTPRMYRFEYPFPPAAVVEFFRVNYGPMARAFAALDTKSQAAMREELEDLWSSANTAGAGVTRLEAEYLEVVGIRAA
ncbi:MAG: class I SAM-dependent methyltransferase [Bryobacteraceae bacterium]